MTTTPELDAAIRNEIGCLNAEECGWPNCRSCKPRVDIILRVLRSLATPTPEVIEAMAIGVRRNQFERTRRHSFDETVPPTEAELNNARAAHAALWAHILGEAKPADLPPDLSTRGNRP